MQHPENSFDAIIIGGGAAGLMCALTAGNRGRRVLLLEVSNKLGKKILMSGGGRCNFTNLDISADNFICENRHFVKSALSQYTQWDFIAMVDNHGVAWHDKQQGQLFCDNSSKDILQMLTTECQQAGVEILLNCEVAAVSVAGGDWRIETNLGRFAAAKLVVATGGLSIPTLGGATGLGYRIARQFGLFSNQTDASLVPFTLTGKWQEFSSALSGVSLPVEVSVPRKSFSESLLFTHRGLSGPAILQLSNYWYAGEQLTIDLLPGVDAAAHLLATKKSHPNSTISSVLINYLPKSLVHALQRQWWSSTDETDATLHNFKNHQLLEIGSHLNCWRITPAGTEGYRTAEVTRGGVDVSGISSKTMQVNEVEGLYIIGEVLDVTGHLGGYNFQWAWSTGYVAGTNI